MLPSIPGIVIFSAMWHRSSGVNDPGAGVRDVVLILPALCRAAARSGKRSRPERAARADASEGVVGELEGARHRRDQCSSLTLVSASSNVVRYHGFTTSHAFRIES